MHHGSTGHHVYQTEGGMEILDLFLTGACIILCAVCLKKLIEGD